MRPAYELEPARAAIRTGDWARLREVLAADPTLATAHNPGEDGLLHEAARAGNLDACRYLLDAGADVQAPGVVGDTPLHEAVRRKHTAVVALLLEKGASATDPDWLGETPLDLAVECDDTALSKLILNHGGRAHARNVLTGMTAFHDAAMEGRIGQVRQLLDAGADPLQTSDDGLNVIQAAAAAGKTDVVALLLQHSGPLDLFSTAAAGAVTRIKALLPTGAREAVAARDRLGRTPLHWAAHCGQAGAAELLLQAGAFVDWDDREQQTPLHLAAARGHTGVVRLLLKAGADPNLRDMANGTPLHRAAKGGALDCACELLAAGAEVDSRDSEQATPLINAMATAYHHDPSALVRLLLEHGADPNAHSTGFMAASAFALALSRWPTLGEAFLRHGADVNGCSARGRSLLHGAAQGSPDLVAFLLTHGCTRVNARDDDGRTPLHLAAEAWCGAAVTRLVAAGADINAVDQEGQSALHIAINAEFAGATEGGDLKATIAALLAAGAAVDLRDKLGQTALHMVAWHERWDSAGKALVAAGADVQARDSAGTGLLRAARNSGCSEMAADLVAAGLEPDPWTAADLDDTARVAAMLDADPALLNTPEPDDGHGTLLEIAAFAGHQELVTMLLRRGANTAAHAAGRWSALHGAAARGHVEVARALLAAGADVNAITDDGKTPLDLLYDYAFSGLNATMVSLLTEHGGVRGERGSQ